MDDTSDPARDLAALRSTTAGLRSELESVDLASRQLGRALVGALDGAILRGRDLGDVLRSLALQLSSIALKAAFRPMESMLGSLLSGQLSGGDPFSGAAAGLEGLRQRLVTGGSGNPLTPLAAGAPPAARSGASVTPAGPSITFNVTAADAESFRRSQAQITALLARSVGRGQRNL